MMNTKEESEKTGLKFNINKTKIMTSTSFVHVMHPKAHLTLMANIRGKVEEVRFSFLELQNHCGL